MPNGEHPKYTPKKWRRTAAGLTTLVALAGGPQLSPIARHIEASAIHAIGEKAGLIPPIQAPSSPGTIVTFPPETASSSPTHGNYTESPQPHTQNVKPFFEVRGTRVYANGKEFIPYGFSIIDSLDQYNGFTNKRYREATDAQIEAAALYWHANAVRLQISEQVILNHPTDGKGYNVPAMKELQRQVDKILSYGLVPIINDNTLFTNYDEADPTKSTIKFWKAVTQYFAERNQNGKYLPIIYDLFNEPRKNLSWSVWQKGDKDHYVGMQAVVNAIRNEPNSMSKNLIWIETPNFSASLAGLDQYPIKDKDNDEEFSAHHLDLNHPSTWAKALGLDLKHKVAIVNGEWSEFISDSRAECYSEASRTVLAYLQLLEENGIGQMAWGLERGIMVYANHPLAASDTLNNSFPTNPGTLKTPTIMTPIYACKNPKARGEGAGAFVKAYYKKNSRPVRLTRPSR